MASRLMFSRNSVAKTVEEKLTKSGVLKQLGKADTKVCLSY